MIDVTNCQSIAFPEKSNLIVLFGQLVVLLVPVDIVD
jgi:hypothetical protein